jgi:hypothetical protein
MYLVNTTYFTHPILIYMITVLMLLGGGWQLLNYWITVMGTVLG